MRGDKLVIQEWHKKAARRIMELLRPQTKPHPKKLVISMAGESGAGKSEIAFVLAESFKGDDISSIILQQDDYFVYPPRTNAEMRGKDIKHVGLSEVRLDHLDDHLGDFIADKGEIRKPLVIFEEDRITQEILPLDDIRIMIVEGTYTTILNNIHSRIFIDRTYKDTKDARKSRGREKQDDFLEKILMIEHEIISSHKAKADIIVTKNYEVIKVDNYE